MRLFFRKANKKKDKKPVDDKYNGHYCEADWVVVGSDETNTLAESAGTTESHTEHQESEYTTPSGFDYVGEGTLVSPSAGDGKNRYFGVVQYHKLGSTVDQVMASIQSAALAEGDQCVGFHIMTVPNNGRFLNAALLYDMNKVDGHTPTPKAAAITADVVSRLFQQTSPEIWTEKYTKQQYDEISRDACSIYLKYQANGLEIQLDIHTNQVKSNGKTLYKIISADSNPKSPSGSDNVTTVSCAAWKAAETQEKEITPKLPVSKMLEEAGAEICWAPDPKKRWGGTGSPLSDTASLAVGMGWGEWRAYRKVDIQLVGDLA